MLGREVNSFYEKNSLPIVAKEIKEITSKSDYVFANLEAPIAGNLITETKSDIMKFIARPKILNEVDFIDGFSLANNHINDAGIIGIEESIKHLSLRKFDWNGFYVDIYKPILIKKNKVKCAIICCTDIINIEIKENNFKRKLLWLDDEILDNVIVEYKKKGYFVVLYVHGGIMFSRYPNPLFREVLYNKIDKGVDTIVTVHPHVLGCEENYKGKKIFYSLGDFIMDGHSNRRRASAILNIKIMEDFSIESELIPTIISKNLTTKLAIGKRKRMLLNSWNSVSINLERNSLNYNSFYKKQFRKEILLHILSTLIFQFKNKSFVEIGKLFLNRAKDFKNMGRWMVKDTSKMRNNLEDKSML